MTTLDDSVLSLMHTSMFVQRYMKIILVPFPSL